MIFVVGAHAGVQQKSSDAGSISVDFFESKVRPTIESKCVACHGPKQQIADVRLDKPLSAEQAKKVLEAIAYTGDTKMPPSGKLPADQLASMSAWAKAGAPWPTSKPNQPKKDGKFWSFVPPQMPSLPSVKMKSWAQNPLDQFVLAKLEEKGMKPAQVADRRTLIRRATFDLTGLPPTPAEIDAFLADKQPNAFERVIDRLLASPAYGERWGRHWLDVARYADSNGLDENLVYLNAWRYRDWVIQSMNQDKPVDRFMQEQIAGDLMPDAGDDGVVATGYLALGAKMLAEDDPQKQELDIIDEQVDTMSKTFLALTVGCARCHDHKFDPISAKDYYSMASIFKSTKTMMNFKVVAEWNERPLGSKEDKAKVVEVEAKVHQKQGEINRIRDKASQDLLKEIQPLQPEYEKAGKEFLDDKDSKTKPADRLAAIAKAHNLIPEVLKDVSDRIKNKIDVRIELPEKRDHLFPAAVAADLKKLEGEVVELNKTKPKLPYVMAVEEGKPTNLKVHLRGSYLTLGDECSRRFPTVVSDPSTPVVPKDHSGRLELAEWLTSAKNPLTARVFVNRVWRWKFGRGLVGSVDNFGSLGDLPTHPELLDWLAVTFQKEDHWSLKKLQKRIMLTNTYMMSGRYDAKMAEVDTDNHYLWRFPRQRLDAEEIRDSIFFVSGTLDRKMGGTLINLPPRAYVTNDQSANPINYDSPRRAVYLPVVRAAVYDVYTAFDFGDPTVMNGDRASTTIAPQALFMLNGKIVLTASKAQATSLLKRSDLDDKGRVQWLYETCFGRPATEEEVTRSLSYLSRFEAIYTTAKEPKLSAWQSLCKTFIGANEFIYVE